MKQLEMKITINVELGGSSVNAQLIDGELWVALSGLDAIVPDDIESYLGKLHRRCVRLVRTDDGIDWLVDSQSVAGWLAEWASKERIEDAIETSETEKE